jgi:RNA polymerase sigma-70 factor (ECF subfamily)
MLRMTATPEQEKRNHLSNLAREHHRDLLVLAKALVKDEHAANDIVQESFVAAWKNMDKFDNTRDFGAWMRGVVRNKWREYLRKNKKETSLDDNSIETMEGIMQNWQSNRQDGGPSIFAKLEECLQKLPEAMATAIQLTYTVGLKSEEAAEQLDISSSNLRKRLERARLKLKQCLERNTQSS